MAELVEESLVSVVNVDSLREDHFDRLVAGRSVETLDDGEAATLAYAVEFKAVALVDERKAIALGKKLYPALTLGCTVDLFAHENVETALGRNALAEAVFASLQEARMRVLPHHEAWVMDLIGAERARNCLSLRAKLRFPERDSMESR